MVRVRERAFRKGFAGDLSTAGAKVQTAGEQRFRRSLLSGKVTQATWRSEPSFYAVSTEDQTINPDLERFMAKRMNARTVELKSSHLSPISHHREVADLILEAAGAPNGRRG